ncbi:putative ABC transport system permease protein [Methylomarinovum tepidoasis]|uniref:ABC transport system permease protein n=1 Tax=Methylomarinovum tepidoasis TaxID=2840183 RepID=A0AAU9C669_9GAMM|nr:FtsX-like permease family protein [Methylomarinovum sp. IN45]BCX88669.1 putative ABC transport system permease protein [Methylomarinovum sp. IN45]
MNDLRLAWRLLKRDWRGGELGILLLALLIAVTATTAIVLAGGRLSRTMTLQAADFLAADLVVSGHRPLPRAWLEQGRALGLETAETVAFATMLVEGERLLLAGVKAVSAGYPLRGWLKVRRGGIEAEVRHPPPPGRVWVARRIPGELGLEVGDVLHVGEAGLAIDGVLTFEPDVRGGFSRFAPRVLMRLKDLPATGVLGPGSRAHYAYLFAGDEARIRRLRVWLEKHLQPGQRLLDIYQERPDIGRALRRAERFLGLASVVVVVIAGVAVAMAARRYSERHFDAVAVLKCLGADSMRVLRLHLYQFLLLGLGAGLVGSGTGWALQEGLVRLLRALLPPHLVAPRWQDFGFGPLVAAVLLLGFALPPLLRLRRVAPLRVLRRDLLPIPVGAWLVYGAALLAVGSLLWRFSGEPRLIAWILGGGSAALLVLALLTMALLWGLRLWADRWPLAGRLALLGLTRHPGAALGQILAFAVTLAAMALGTRVQGDLLETWRAQLPADAPNYFVINLFPGEVADFERSLRQIGAKPSAFYPVVRGRLLAIDGEDVKRRARPDSVGEAAVNRELNLTWAVRLPRGNRLLAGRWWPRQAGPQVSVERDLAQSLGIELGSRLAFLIEGRRLEAVVTSIRQVRWDSMTPNFYVIFAPGDLDGFAATYMSSFYLPPDRQPQLATLLRAFPNATLIDVDMILKHLRRILRQVSFAVQAMLGFALLAGVVVLAAAVRSALDARIRQGALLRTLGARQRLLRRSQGLEFALLGGIAGVLAVAVSEALAWGLYTWVFHLDFRPRAAVWWGLPLIGAVLTSVAGMWSCRGVLRASPLTLLRDL